MIVYSGSKREFCQDVASGQIADIIQQRLSDKQVLASVSESEYRSWSNSLPYMYIALQDQEISDDVNVAIEYQVPLTSKRVDFIISGQDDQGANNIVIVELKQWEKADRTSRDGVVTTLLGGTTRAVTHPCYQAYSYARTIEHYNSAVGECRVQFHPCAFLHNYKAQYRDQIDNDFYAKFIELAPLFLKNDLLRLQQFIKRYVKHSDKGDLLYQLENGKIRPSKSLQDSIVSMMQGNEDFIMLDEQKVVFETIATLIGRAIKKADKYCIIVEGGPGTGKSVIALNLLAQFKHLNVRYVTKTAAPRDVYFRKLVRGNYKMSYLKNLFMSSGAFVNSQPGLFDCLLVDEAHRLNAKSGMFANMGENQIKEIINAARVSVFFIDESQVVTTKDIGSVAEIRRWATELGCKIIHGPDTKLVSQFRCNGSDGYLLFLDNLLGIRETANTDLVDIDYDFRVFDDPCQMREELRALNDGNKARMIAGYCYPWASRKDRNAYDIILENGFMARWNLDSTKTWAIDEDSFEEVGCIHSSQGLEFEYVGIIIGLDLCYREGVITDPSKRARDDASVKGAKSREMVDKIIRNTYKTLMSRGQKGCFVYCQDPELRDYIKRVIGQK